MQSSEFGNSAAVPYRRETFITKKIVLDFDGGFNLADAASLSNNAKAKSLSKIFHDIDSINGQYDSVGRNYLSEANVRFYSLATVGQKDSARLAKRTDGEFRHLIQ